MPSTLAHRPLGPPDSWSASELHALLESVAALKRTRRRSGDWQPLRGRHLALLCGCGDADGASFSEAMAAAGASVAQLNADTWLHSAGDALPKAARLLGRLYDAVDCCRMAAPLIEQIERHAAVPVFDGIGLDNHPTQLIADLLTMREATPRPLERLEVRLCGRASSTPYREAAALLAQAGIAVRHTRPGPGRSGEEATDFVLDVDALQGPARLRAPGASRDEQARIDRLLVDNRHAVRQAIVANALG